MQKRILAFFKNCFHVRVLAQISLNGMNILGEENICVWNYTYNFQAVMFD